MDNQQDAIDSVIQYVQSQSLADTGTWNFSVIPFGIPGRSFIILPNAGTLEVELTISSGNPTIVLSGSASTLITIPQGTNTYVVNSGAVIMYVPNDCSTDSASIKCTLS